MKVTNHFLQPVVLEDGTVIAASGTDGSTKEVTLSEGDAKRYVRPGMLVIVEETAAVAAQNAPELPSASESTTRRKESK